MIPAPLKAALLVALGLAGGCARWNPPHNLPLTRDANPPLVAEATPPGDGSTFIGLAFSGGGMRASAFAYGMTEELRQAGVGGPNGLLEDVRLVSGVSGGSVTAAQLGLYGPQGLRGFREKYLLTDAEKYMANSIINPLTLVQGLAGGANSRASFGRYLDEVLYKGATFADLGRHSQIKTWINATDMANGAPFLFSPETFDALCSDLSRFAVSDAVAASSAVPLVFAPMVLEVHRGKCAYSEPDWLTAARHNPEATQAMRAHGRALESYADPGRVQFVKLIDGGVTDNFGTTGIAVERARARAAFPPMTAAEAVRLKRMLFLVADAGVHHDYSWTMQIGGPGALGLAKSVANSAIGSATRSGYDAMRGQMRQWQEDLIEWRCALSASEVRRLRGTSGAWDCSDVKIFVGLANSDAIPDEMRTRLNAVPTRLRLSAEDVDLAIEAGRIATRASPEFNGFLQSLDGNRVEDRIAAGIARGGRRLRPMGQ